MPDAVIVEKVIKVYESRGDKVTALREVSMRVAEGEVVAIMGPSGSGKTTLLNLIAGVDYPTAGKVVVHGRDLMRLTEEELRLYRLLEVGYVFQQYNLVPTLTVLENVLLPMTIAGRRDEQRARALLASVGLAGKEGRYPEELSGGEQQRLAIAVALANDPKLIIADEPTGELDLATGEVVVRLLTSQSREHGKTVIMTTHDPRVARMADRVILLEDGRIRGSYEPSRISTTGAHEEVTVERVVVEHLKNMLESVRERIRRLPEKIARNEITLEEAFNEYNRLRALEQALIDELARLGAGSEAIT